jgi:hypothetical protein
MIPGRVWAYVGAVLGGSVSIAANVAHSYVPPDGAPDGWTPHAGAVAAAAVWPVIALLGLEILARNRLRPGLLWATVRLGMVPVAAVAAFVSYRHMSALLTFYGEDGWSAGLGPLAVDGLMVMAAAVLLAEPMEGASTARSRTEPTAAWTARTPLGQAVLDRLTGPVQEPSTQPPEPVQDQPVDRPREPSTPRPRTRPADELAPRRRASRKPSTKASTRGPTKAEQAVMDELGVSRSKAGEILRKRRAEAEA